MGETLAQGVSANHTLMNITVRGKKMLQTSNTSQYMERTLGSIQ